MSITFDNYALYLSKKKDNKFTVKPVENSEDELGPVLSKFLDEQQYRKKTIKIDTKRSKARFYKKKMLKDLKEGYAFDWEGKSPYWVEEGLLGMQLRDIKLNQLNLGLQSWRDERGDTCHIWTSKY
tara:strand:+ start:439 stop:816 length:378 start_codon:yes stop_codon:yes gene_type:complete